MAALARLLVERGREVLVVDGTGDVGRILGVAAAARPDHDVAAQIGGDVEGRCVVPGLRLLELPQVAESDLDSRALVTRLAATAESGHDVLVDLSTSAGAFVELAGSIRLAQTTVPHMSLMVTRCCYLALAGFTRSARPVDAVAVVSEPGRALRARDVEAVVRAPVLADIPFDPAISRAVDAGLLAWRVPACLDRALAPLCDHIGATR